MAHSLSGNSRHSIARDSHRINGGAHHFIRSLLNKTCVALVRAYWIRGPVLHRVSDNSRLSLPSMSASGNYIIIGLAVVATALALMRKKLASRRLAYPPGPKGYPIVGNVFDFPQNPVWEGLARMAKEYSESTVLRLRLRGVYVPTIGGLRYGYFASVCDGPAPCRVER